MADEPKLFTYGVVNKMYTKRNVDGSICLVNHPNDQWDTFFTLCVLNAKECMLQNSYLEKHRTDKNMLKSWKGKEFIAGWGLLVVLVVVGGKEPSGARGQRSAACTQQLS